jgi:hypothetical protein
VGRATHGKRKSSNLKVGIIPNHGHSEPRHLRLLLPPVAAVNATVDRYFLRGKKRMNLARLDLKDAHKMTTQWYCQACGAGM